MDVGGLWGALRAPRAVVAGGGWCSGMVRIDAAADRCADELVRLPACRPPPRAASSTARRAPSRPFPTRSHVLRAAGERPRAVRSARAPPARRRCALWVTADENRASSTENRASSTVQLSCEQKSSQMAAESMLHRHGADRRHHGRRPGPSPR